ncbi:hypothetical protein EDD15DRAFT_389522 [Pisolithus albus]|nr:hypothetical protein EDD15DRAFT_389522 [Pisolithus albus]
MKQRSGRKPITGRLLTILSRSSKAHPCGTASLHGIQLTIYRCSLPYDLPGLLYVLKAGHTCQRHYAPYALLAHVFFKKGAKNLISFKYQTSPTIRPSNHIRHLSSQTTTGTFTVPTAALPLVHFLNSSNAPALSALTAGTPIFPDRLSRR